jgi:hypothetical protein
MTAEYAAAIRAPPHNRGANIIPRRIRDVEAVCVSDHERNGFGFELARVTRAGTVIAVMKKFVRLCSEVHKRTYVQLLVMSGRVGRDRFPRSKLDVMLRVAVQNACAKL